MSQALQLSLLSPRRVFAAPVLARAPYAEPTLPPYEEAGWDHTIRGAVGVDVESYVNFFVICFKRFADGKRLAFERSERADLNREEVLAVLNGNVTISFNGLAYDLPMIYLALAGADTVKLKALSDEIVSGDLRPWDVEKRAGVRVPKLNHIDLIETNPAVRQGLKILGGRLHCRYVVDLPYPPAARLTPEQMEVTTRYCFNDLDTTEALYRALREPLELRVALGKQYGVDLRSKSDSQIGEIIVKRRVEAALGKRLENGVRTSGPKFGYEPPSFLKFGSVRLNGILEDCKSAEFYINAVGKTDAPKFLKDLKVAIGSMSYTMGIGGLHSTEAHRALYSDIKYFLLDVDVASQYPNIIMKLGIFPRAMGPAFLKIYGDLIKDRLAAKAAGDKARADGGRIALNGVYGKLGSLYSSLYSPHLLIAVTLTGQLAILMLIERAETAGISVVSANTDGVVFRCPRAAAAHLEAIISGWEADTGFSVEKTPYKALYSSSVNTYIAVKEDGKIKRKGSIADPWSEGDLRGQMMKNPQMTICSEAIVRYLVDGIPVEDTIRNAVDPRHFVTVIKVTGGALWRGHLLGRAVRYYWSLDGDPIFYADGSKRVSKTEGARPLQEITDTLPEDVDYLRYVEETSRLAEDLGIRGL